MRKSIDNYPVFLNIAILVYSLYISLSVFTEKVMLADDLIKVHESRSISQNYFSFIYSFLDSATMAARPVSGLVTGTLMYLSMYDESVYWLGLFFFPLSLFIIYKVAQEIVSIQLAGLITLLYSCCMIGTSIQFSAIMLNSNLATIFFCLSIYFVYVRRNIIISSLFFILSVLSYEIFLPIIILHLFLIKENKKRIVFIILTVSIIVIFRKIVQPAIFVNSYQRDEVSKIFDIKRVAQISIYSVKLFFRDIFSGICKSIQNLKKVSFFEWIFLIVIPSLVYKIFFGYDFRNQWHRSKYLLIISLIAIFCGMSIFIFSSYIPTIFGFDNRNLGAVRLFYTLLIISAVIFFGCKLNVGNKIIAVFFAVTVFFFILTDISVKNSWIYAHHFNRELFHKLKTAIKENNIRTGIICLDYDVFNELKTNPDFTFREPTFFNNLEAPALSEMNGIDPGKIHVHNVERNKDCSIIFKYKNGKMVRLK